MTAWAKAAITLAIAVALAYVLMSLARDEDVQSEVPVSAFDDQLIALERQALDQAYAQQAQFLFSVWMKDSTGQPDRFSKGMRQARRAYIDSATAIEQRK